MPAGWRHLPSHLCCHVFACCIFYQVGSFWYWNGGDADGMIGTGRHHSVVRNSGQVIDHAAMLLLLPFFFMHS